MYHILELKWQQAKSYIKKLSGRVLPLSLRKYNVTFRHERHIYFRNLLCRLESHVNQVIGEYT